ncbi:hypothetical protein L3X38_036435 [Prunus dulcis]|uniref:Uncharacterized protein n=1 Tax=Prunus dulcis TaxID=3755 RepID=A0AAD4V1N9_PRUDU|nr:hypothetical protein L3X38_036435 [Prunus dulcis]
MTEFISIQIVQAMIDRVHVDKGSVAYILQLSVFQQMGMEAKINRTLSSSSIQFPSASSNIFFRQSNIILSDASAWPLPCGYHKVDKCCLMPYFAKNAVICLPMNCDPLSVISDYERPNRHMMFFQTNRSMSASLVEDRALALIHLVNANPRLVNASACVFSARGTCWMVKIGNALKIYWTLWRNWIIIGCFAMYSPEA